MATDARLPLTESLAILAASRSGSFEASQSLFLDAMWQFDQHVVNGLATQGDIRNGKGDFFNDFLRVLLGACSGKEVQSRPNIPGLSFANHKLDIAYPLEGPVQVAIETKATGVPLHGGNPRQKNLAGRPGSADLEKRIKEAAFKNIDVKGERARSEGRGGGATNDLGHWLRSTPPRCYLFLACRVVDDNDLRKAASFAQTASVWFDRCGLFTYRVNATGTGYVPAPVHPTISLDRVMAEVCTVLRNLP
ncbi:MAG TPA: hypothetical protein PKA49_15310 [Tepidiformaceae bacterium]|nr:hypothetical protein [Tepidiformaceae bacterium]